MDNVTTPCFLGIDAGNTLVKALIFDLSGNELGYGQTTCDYSFPRPHWVERDMNRLWEGVCDAIKLALDNSKVTAEQIKAVSVTGHGDGVYIVDKQGNPIRAGIPSIDTRAGDVIDELKEQSKVQKILDLTGQGTYIFSAAVLLAWIKKHERANYDQIGFVLSCKDWIRFKLTGQFFTDFTEASTSFTDVRTQAVTKEAFDLYGIEELYEHFPEVKLSFEEAGKITKQASIATSLNEGTIVASGLHDIDATSIGIGCVNPGQLEIIAGTWSINQIILDKFVIDPKLMCRNFIVPGQWTSLTGSPASATNLEWFVNQLCKEEIEKSKSSETSKFRFIDEEIAPLLDKKSEIFFLPFMYGSPYSQKASAGFLGVKGWHTRSDLLLSVFEGVVFNHLVHVNWLKQCSSFHEIRLTGGGAKNRIWSQMFADAIGEPVIISRASESGTLGSAICGTVASGYYPTIYEAIEKMVKIKEVYVPSQPRHAYLQEKFTRYEKIIDALTPIWISES